MTIDDRHRPQPHAFDDLLTLREVVEVLRVPEVTLRYWIDKEPAPPTSRSGTPHPLPPRRAPAPGCEEQRRGGALIVADLSRLRRQDDGVLIRFDESARRHRIGRGSVLLRHGQLPRAGAGDQWSRRAEVCRDRRTRT